MRDDDTAYDDIAYDECTAYVLDDIACEYRRAFPDMESLTNKQFLQVIGRKSVTYVNMLT